MASLFRPPTIPSLLEGFLNLRGTAVPVLSLGRLFGLHERPLELHTPLVILRGEMGHKNFWLWDPQTATERQLTDLPSNFAIGDFDVAPDGAEIIFERVQDSSNIALIER